MCGTYNNFQDKNHLGMGFIWILFFCVEDLVFFLVCVLVCVFILLCLGASCVCFMWIFCLYVFLKKNQYNSNINFKLKYIVKI
jgi:hypothetical protein